MKQKVSFPSYGLSLFEKNCTYQDARLALVGVPWSVTASFRGGADLGPEIIASASSQMDFFSKDVMDVRSQGIYFMPSSSFLKKLNKKMRVKAKPILSLESKAPGAFANQPVMQDIHKACQQMVSWVYDTIQAIDQAGKLFGLIGGDHSVSEGALKYVGEKYKTKFGVLHIDAHADLRKSYQGFRYSHASIMHNVLNQKYPPSHLTQVGVRDYSKEEYQVIQSKKNIHTFFDSDIQAHLLEGGSWKDIVKKIIQTLPKKVYLSLDVDGLNPELFPHTGTPVPGGLNFSQTCYLLKTLAKEREIIGFDLVEVAGSTTKTHTIDALVAAHLLYFICQNVLQTNKN